MSSTGHTSTRQAHHCPHPTSRGVPFARPDLRGPTRIDRFAKPGLVAHENRVIAARAKDSDLEINHSERMIFALGENKAEYIQLSGTNMAAAVVSGAGQEVLSHYAAALYKPGEVAQALSPRVFRYEENAMMGFEKTEVLWGGSEWSLAYLWNDGYLWNDNTLTSDSAGTLVDDLKYIATRLLIERL